VNGKLVMFFNPTFIATGRMPVPLWLTLLSLLAITAIGVTNRLTNQPAIVVNGARKRKEK
jgi:hypothetical protein